MTLSPPVSSVQCCVAAAEFEYVLAFPWRYPPLFVKIPEALWSVGEGSTVRCCSRLTIRVFRQQYTRDVGIDVLYPLG